MSNYSDSISLARLLHVGVVLVVVALLLVAQSVTAQPAPTINYQGKLLDNTSATVADADYSMVFRLYTDPTGGTNIWSETQTVTVQNGLFSVMLGSSTALSSVDFNQPLYLGVNIEADGEMTPRKPLGTVPAAFEAERLGGVASSSFLRSDQADSMDAFLTLTSGASTSDLVVSGTASTTNLAVGSDFISDLTGAGLTITGNALGVATTTLGLGDGTLDGLSDVNTAGALAGNLFSFDGSGWSTTSTSTLGLGDGTFLGLSDTPGSFTSNRLLFTNGAGDAVTDSANLTFDGTTLALTGTSTISGGLSVAETAAFAGRVEIGTSNGAAIYQELESTPFLFASQIPFLGNANTVLGASALAEIYDSSSSGNQSNTVVGALAATNLVSGGSNVTLGESSFSVATGSDNVVIGASAMSSTVGEEVNNSLVIGYRAGNNLQTGSDNNLLLGYQAADSLTTGANNIIIGYDVEAPSNTASNQLNIGNLLFGTGIDGTGTTTSSGNIGIGTTSPSSKLDVWGDFRVGTGSVPTLFADSANDWVGIGTTSRNFGSGATTTERLTVAGGGIIANSPTDPQIVGGVDTTGSARGVAVAGRYAYVADGTNGLEIIDVSDPQNPTIVGGVDTAGSAWDVTLAGRYAYVADFGNGLEIIDISDPTNPSIVGGVNTAGTARGVTLAGRYAYVADDSNGLEIIDVSDPQNPTIVGGVDTAGSAWDVTLAGRYAYVVDLTNGFIIIDVSDPTNPVEVGNWDDGGFARDVTVLGSYAYVADYTGGISGGFEIIDVSDPTNPVEVGNWDDGGLYGNVAVAGQYAYLIDESSGLEIIDISDPTNPSIVGGVNTAGTARGVTLAGRYAYVADDSNGLEIVDIGGSEFSSLFAGALGATQANIDQDLTVGQNALVQSNLSVGNDARIGGLLSIQGYSSSTDTRQQALLSLGGESTRNSFMSFLGGVSSTTQNTWSLGLDNTDGAFRIASSSGLTTNNYFSILNNGNVGIGTTSPSSKLTVAGDGYFGGNLTATGTLDVQGTGTSTLAGNLDLAGALTFNSEYFTDLTGTGLTNTTGALSVATTTLGLGDGTFLGLTDTPGSFTSNRLLFTNSGGNAVTDSASLTFDGTNLDLAGTNTGLAFQGTRFFYATTTLNNIAIGEGAGENMVDTGNAGDNFNVFLGYQAGQNASTTVFLGNTNNSFIGYRAGQNNTGKYSNFIGDQAGQNNTGNSNNFLGGAAGQNNTGSTNNFFGQYAGQNNTGSQNNILGFIAGEGNTGSYNNLFGSSAGYTNTGSYSEFIGFETGAVMSASSTVAIGGLALRGGSGSVFSGNAATTTNNTVIGYGAGYNVATGGDNNLLLGYRVADSLTTGANNIVIGYDVEAPSNTASNQLNIGNLLFGTGIDGTGTTTSSGNIGIGTTSPSSKLDVWGDFRVGTGSVPTLFADTANDWVGIGTTSRNFGSGATTTERLTVAGGGIIANSPTNPQIVGGVDTDGDAWGVTLAGRYAYVADFGNGLEIIDVSDPTNPTIVGGVDTAGNAYAVTVAGRYAYVADDGNGLEIIDVSDPQNPTIVGGVDTAGSAKDVTVAGRYAYVADFGNGLEIIDVSDPTNPTIVGGVDTARYAYAVTVAGRYAYVAGADFGGSLEIIDVSDPQNPSVVGGVFTYGQAYGVTVAGRYAYVADGGNGFEIIDVSDPTNPTIVGGVATVGSARGVTIAGRYAYLADLDGFEIIDVSDPTNPTIVGGVDTADNAISLTIAGRYAYVADDGNGLEIIDIGGSEFSSLFAGALGATQANIDQDLTVGQNALVQSNLNVGNDARVGGLLSIQGYSSSTDTRQQALLSLGGESTRNSFMSFLGGVDSTTQNTWSLGLDNTDGAFRIASSSGLTTNNYFSILNNGNVGIGTSSPDRKLTVQQTADYEGLRIYGADDEADTFTSLSIGSGGETVIQASAGGGTLQGWGGTYTLNWDDNNFTVLDNIEFEFGTDEDYGLGYNSSDDTFRIFDGNDVTSDVNTRLTIDSTGNIGIGSTTPSSKLTVAGDTYIGGALRATGTVRFDALTSGLLEADANGNLSAVATSSLGLGDGTFLGLSDTPGSFTSNRLLFTNSGGNAVTDSASLTFDGSNLDLAGANTGLAFQGTRFFYASTTNDSIAIGYRAGQNNTARYVTAIGTYAARDNTNEDVNAIGRSAAVSNSGEWVNAIGTYAARANSGEHVNAIGNYAANTNTGSYSDLIGFEAGGGMSASNTVAIGRQTLRAGGLYQPAGSTAPLQNATTTNNTALGAFAGYNVLTGGDNNLLLGYRAGYGLTTGANNIVIGYDVEAPSNTASNQLNIGNLLFGTGIDGTGTTLSSGNIGIGTTSPNAKLTVAGDINIDDPDSGISFMGERLIYATNSAIFIGKDVAASSTAEAGVYDIMIGDSAGNAFTSGSFSDNILLGRAAGEYGNGNENTIIGSIAGNQLDGDRNLVAGFAAGRGVIGSNNIALGTEALRGVFGGFPVTLQTFSASNTIAIGYQAGLSSGNGSDNNILLGYRAADSLTTGANNIVIGYDVEAPSNTASNQLNIGNLIFSEGIDGTGTTLSSGNIGIGTTSPSSKLTVAGDTYIGGALRATGTVRFDALTSGLLEADANGNLSAVATSSLGLGDGTFLGLSDTPGSYTSNRLLFTNSGGNAVTDSASLTFDGTNFGIGSSSPTRQLTIASSGTQELYVGTSDVSGTDAGITINGGRAAAQAISPFISFTNTGVTNQLGRIAAFRYDGTTSSEGGLLLTDSGVGGIQVAYNRLFLSDTLSGPQDLSSTYGSEGSITVSDQQDSYIDIITDNNNSNTGRIGAFRVFNNGLPGTGTQVGALGYDEDADVLTLSRGVLSDMAFNIDSSGNVGIGTTTPTDKLSVAQSADGSGVSIYGFDDRADRAAELNINAAGQFSINVVGAGLGLLSQDGVDVAAWSQETFYLADGKELGFGAGQDYAFGYRNSDDSFVLVDGTNVDNDTSVRMSLTNTGNIGIGTTSPSSKLTVAGDTYIGGALRATGTVRFDALTSGLLEADANGNLSAVATSSLGLGDGTFLGLTDTPGSFTTDQIFYQSGSAVTSSADFTFDGTQLSLGGTGLSLTGSTANIALGSNWLSGDGGDEGVFVASDGDVGIGTASPGAKFEVVGDTTITNTGAASILRIDRTDGTIAGLRAGGATMGFDFDNTGTFQIAPRTRATINGTSFPVATEYIQMDGSGNFDVNGQFYLEQSSGNVGIGTTSPASKLDVWGDFRVGTGSSPVLYANSANGQVSVGTTTSSSSHLSVYGDKNTGIDLFTVRTDVGASNESSDVFSIGDGGFFKYGQGLEFSGVGPDGAWVNFTSGPTNGLFGFSAGDDYFRINPLGGFAGTNVLNVQENDNSYLVVKGGDAGADINAGNVGIGTTSPSSKLTLENLTLDGAGVSGLEQNLVTTNSVDAAVQYGNRFTLNASNTATTTIVGSIYRVADDTTFGNTVRGLEVQTNQGSNTQGENTALSGFARTFGVRGVTTGDAGGDFEPAGGFFESEGTTQGNAIRGFSSSITTASLLSLFQDTSSFTGTGLEMNFGNSTGDFASTSSKYLDFQNSGTSVFTVSAYGTTTIGDGTTNNMAGLQIGFGGLCVDNDGTCAATTTGQIASVSTYTGNSDLAEMYFSSTALTPGEVVTMAGELSVERAAPGQPLPILGVVSTKPGVVMGADDTSTRAGESAYPIALSGRVPVRLSTENGPIAAGDELMLSSIPGVAMKATGTGQTIGIALEDFDVSRKYSPTYINQFGDDMVDPIYEPIATNDDPRIDDGCYYGGGSAAGEAPCEPLTATTSSGQIAEANERAAQESVAEQLADLARERSERATLPNGDRVSVGQAVMFVERSYRWLDDTQQAAIASLLSTSSLTTVGEDETETLFDRLVALANSFVDGVLTLTGLKADKIETNELCIDGVCVTGDELRQLLDGQAATAGTASEESTATTQETDAATDDTTTDTSTDDTTDSGTSTSGAADTQTPDDAGTTTDSTSAGATDSTTVENTGGSTTTNASGSATGTDEATVEMSGSSTESAIEAAGAVDATNTEETVTTDTTDAEATTPDTDTTQTDTTTDSGTDTTANQGTSSEVEAAPVTTESESTGSDSTNAEPTEAPVVEESAPVTDEPDAAETGS